MTQTVKNTDISPSMWEIANHFRANAGDENSYKIFQIFKAYRGEERFVRSDSDIRLTANTNDKQQVPVDSQAIASSEENSDDNSTFESTNAINTIEEEPSGNTKFISRDFSSNGKTLKCTVFGDEARLECLRVLNEEERNHRNYSFGSSFITTLDSDNDNYVVDDIDYIEREIISPNLGKASVDDVESFSEELNNICPELDSFLQPVSNLN